VHSLGPGHGKSLVASFFMKEKHPQRKSLAEIIWFSVFQVKDQFPDDRGQRTALPSSS
jgi:hypothetical protein